MRKIFLVSLNCIVFANSMASDQETNSLQEVKLEIVIPTQQQEIFESLKKAIQNKKFDEFQKTFNSSFISPDYPISPDQLIVLKKEIKNNLVRLKKAKDLTSTAQYVGFSICAVTAIEALMCSYDADSENSKWSLTPSTTANLLWSGTFGLVSGCAFGHRFDIDDKIKQLRNIKSFLKNKSDASYVFKETDEGKDIEEREAT